MTLGAIRDRFPGEITPVGATHSTTKDDDEENFGAGYAIDRYYRTTSEALEMDSNKKPWLKIALGQVFCVEKVVRYDNHGQVWQTWTCTDNTCTGTGNFASNFNMTIITEYKTADLNLFPMSDCSFGDTVKYVRSNSPRLAVYEMVIIGKVISGTRLGKKYD